MALNSYQETIRRTEITLDRYTYITRLSRIEEDLPKLGNTINALKITNAGTYGQNLEALGIDAARRAERIACSLRNLIFTADLVAPPVLMEWIAREQGITITHTAELVEITLPGLMPKTRCITAWRHTLRIMTSLTLGNASCALPTYLTESCPQGGLGIMTTWNASRS